MCRSSRKNRFLWRGPFLYMYVDEILLRTSKNIRATTTTTKTQHTTCFRLRQENRRGQTNKRMYNTCGSRTWAEREGGCHIFWDCHQEKKSKTLDDGNMGLSPEAIVTPLLITRKKRVRIQSQAKITAKKTANKKITTIYCLVVLRNKKNKKKKTYIVHSIQLNSIPFNSNSGSCQKQ